MPALADVLSTLLLRLWPERRHQERLLDLGERKGWDDRDRSEAVGRFADWLSCELRLSAQVEVASNPAPVSITEVSLPGDLRELHRATPGVGQRTAALARLVGTAPKTLSNTLRGPLRSDRRDHRWLLLLARLERGEPDVDGLIFHRRTPENVVRALGRGGSPDAGDALLAMSLVSLWQRRRPTVEARASRGQPVPRRLVPKPAVALKWDVVTLPQLRPLADAAVTRGGEFGRRLALLVVDAALTEAHLAPHRSRGTTTAETAWGDHWLRSVQGLLSEPGVRGLVGEDEAALLLWRVSRMMAYAAGAPLSPGAPSVHPHVALASAIDAARVGIPVEHRFRARDPGNFMLLPQARRLGLIDDI